MLQPFGTFVPEYVLAAKREPLLNEPMTGSISPLTIGFLIYPNVTQLDVAGPAEILALLEGAKIHMIWKELVPVETSAGFSILPTTTFQDCPPLDLICVPGGDGRGILMDDHEVHEFLQIQAVHARYVTSMCTGSLLLAAAGPFAGKRAACHWAYAHLLSEYGAVFVDKRVVRDGNCISGGGVTAGIDFGLSLVAEIAGEQRAGQIQLSLEYAPEPPFHSGSPHKADPKLIRSVLEEMNDKAFSKMKYLKPIEFQGTRPWQALDVAHMNGISVRLHWTNQPYRWHVNDGQEVFVVLEGCVDMHVRNLDGSVEVTRMEPGMLAHANVGVEHVAHPVVTSRVLVIEKEGSP